jgi:predicted metal-dependent hydrolase
VITYDIIRSSRRTLSLEITADLRVVVRAPYLCSKREIERFVASHEEWIARHLVAQRERAEAAAARQVTPEEEARLRALAAEVIPARVAHYSALMGLTPTGVRITGARKRFGSCSSKNSLCFSWRLMQYPPEAIDYVVVHELAHIRHHNHSAAFYALVAQVLPDHRDRRALLRG